jgi:cobyrinic acid a,c-diamide synthase
MDCRAVGQTAAAVALGLARFDPKVRVAGVILNNIASARHGAGIEQAMNEADLPVLGVIPRSNEVRVPERHLGLVQAQEIETLDARIDQFAALVERYCDVDRCLEAAAPHVASAAQAIQAMPPLGKHIAIARDAAFSFLYPHLLESWRSAGAALSFFSPLNNEGPPQDCDACYLPGGYPELHAARLAGADEFRQALHTFANTFPVYGECGGYMALGDALIDAGGVRHRMAGLLPVVTSFETRKLTLGYRTAELCEAPPFWENSGRITGHEFHYATTIEQDLHGRKPFLRLFDSDSHDLGRTGDCKGQVAGSFFHAIAMMK